MGREKMREGEAGNGEGVWGGSRTIGELLFRWFSWSETLRVDGEVDIALASATAGTWKCNLPSPLDRQTDRPTGQPTNRPTDRPSERQITL